MKALKIITVPDFEKELRTKSKPVDLNRLNDPDLQDFFDDLLFTMLNAEDQVGVNGVGISAVQVNRHIRVFWALDVKKDKPRLYINPEIEVLDSTIVVGKEGCLSIPEVYGMVPRARKIKVKYFDRKGHPHTVVLSGFNARIVQHEYDHLEGILFTDKIVEEL